MAIPPTSPLASQQQIDQRKALAEALMRQKMPEGQQAGRFYVAPSPFAQLASGLTSGIAQYQSMKAGQEQGALDKDNQTKITEALMAQNADPQIQAAIQALPPEQRGQLLGQITAGKFAPKKPAESFTLSPGQQRFGPEGETIANLPEKPAEFTLGQGQQRFGPDGKPIAAVAPAPPNPGPTVNVNTEKSLYGTLAEKQAGQYSDLYAQAQAAPERIDRAARVRALLQSQPITGAGAEQKLAIAKGLKSLGLYDSEDIGNTELLGRELAGSTLEAIKTSGLGGGTGFSNADRDFLEKVTGGSINLDATSLQRVAELNERSARTTLKRWNETSKRLKPEQLQNLGMSPIELPPELPQTSGQVNGVQDLIKDDRYKRFFQQ